MELEKLKKYILFDLDGTLTDPKIGICTCVQYALASFGIDEPDLDKLEPFIGPPLIDSFKEFYGFSDEDAKKGLEKYRERFSTVGLFENKVYPGIRHMLKTLKKNGFHLAVASSKPKVFVEQIMEHFGLAKYFEAMEGSNLDGTGTDKAEIIDRALADLFGKNKVDPEQVYMVGDRKYDCIGAQKKGIECVAVAYGYGDFEELMEAHADYIVFSTRELEEFLMRQTVRASVGRVCRRKGDGGVPISYREFFLLIGVLGGFILLTSLLEIVLSLFAGDVLRLFPEKISNWFYYSKTVNPSSFGYIGNLGVIISELARIIAVAVFICPIVRYIKATKRDSYLLHPMPATAIQYILGVVFSISVTISVQLIVALINVANMDETYQNVASGQYSCMFGVGLVGYGIIAPLVEELIYRGLVYGVFRRYLPLPWAMVISALIFGIIHGNLVQGIYAFVFGCLMVMMYEYYGTFWAAVAMHILANVVTYVLSFVSESHGGIINWPLAGGMAVFAGVSVFMLFRLRRRINT